jgi:hypothetical protein
MLWRISKKGILFWFFEDFDQHCFTVADPGSQTYIFDNDKFLGKVIIWLKNFLYLYNFMIFVAIKNGRKKISLSSFGAVVGFGIWNG